MQPEQEPIQPSQTPESAPSPQTPEAPAARPEQSPAPAAGAERAPTVPPVAPPTTQPPADQQQPQVTGGQPSINAPAAADDVDLIEKEWVNKAKQVIETTKDDPHAQEAGFEELQIEYQKKRYGRNIKPAH